MVESTYGNRDHEPLADVNDRVCKIINRAVEQRGKVIIPSFAVGRTQQLLFTLHHLRETGCIPPIKVFVDSPLAINATAVFRTHNECYNDQFRRIMNNGSNPFRMDNLTYIGSVAESMAINTYREPCVILSASGMAEAGRIRHHIANNIGDPRNTILIVGWCAAHTLGSHLASGHKEVNIFGEPYRVRAKVETINAFSGHADRTELKAWTDQITGPLRNIFVIHGEEESANAFAVTLRQAHPRANVLVPNFADSVEF
jgi:metallo-beta-lactamase family protein